MTDVVYFTPSWAFILVNDLVGHQLHPTPIVLSAVAAGEEASSCLPYQVVNGWSEVAAGNWAGKGRTLMGSNPLGAEIAGNTDDLIS